LDTPIVNVSPAAGAAVSVEPAAVVSVAAAVVVVSLESSLLHAAATRARTASNSANRITFFFGLILFPPSAVSIRPLLL
jgi:hypothetical protein